VGDFGVEMAMEGKGLTKYFDVISKICQDMEF
jgi:hypothetical protein